MSDFSEAMRRVITGEDAKGKSVVIIDEIIARNGWGWPNVNPVGQRLQIAALDKHDRKTLAAAGVRKSAVYTGHYGLDEHLSRDPKKTPISRGVPISKAMEEHSILAYEMNGGDLPNLNGYPLRLIAPGWYGVANVKWLTRIEATTFDAVDAYNLATGEWTSLAPLPTAMPGVATAVFGVDLFAFHGSFVFDAPGTLTLIAASTAF